MTANRIQPEKLFKIFIALVVLVWTTAIGASFRWNLIQQKEEIRDFARHEARAFFKEILITRAWNSGHGGVYVKVTKNTKPNPYLKDTDRDIVVNGVKLTKVNPAFMTRQISEVGRKETDIQFHITSLKPINPANAPTRWEKESLKSFRKATDERSRMIYRNGRPVRLDYMAPLITKKDCLKCHAYQGYKVGDVRGGIRVSVPVSGWLNIYYDHAKLFGIFHAAIWLVGLAAIFFGAGNVLRRMRQADDSARMNRLLLNSLPNPTMLIDPVEKKILVANDAAREMGAVEGAKCFESMRSFMALSESMIDRECRNCPGEEAARLKSPMSRRASARGREWEFHWWPIGDSLLLWYCIDITERLADETTKKMLMDELLDKNKQLETFAYTVSHDLKSPLVTIGGFIGAIEEKITADLEVRGYLDRVSKAVSRMDRLIDEVLEYSRIGRTNTEKGFLGFSDIVSEAADTHRARMEERGVKFEAQAADTVMFGNRVRLLQVFENLIGNAVKYMGSDNPAPQVEAGVEERDGETVFFVRDNGEGIDPKYHESIFDIFHRLPNSKGIDGTGVGLAIVKRVVEVHGGRIWVESRPGAGSAFYFTI